MNDDSDNNTSNNGGAPMVVQWFNPRDERHDRRLPVSGASQGEQPIGTVHALQSSLSVPRFAVVTNEGWRTLRDGQFIRVAPGVCSVHDERPQE